LTTLCQQAKYVARLLRRGHDDGRSRALALIPAVAA
jgi:hypothetical protein